MHDNAWIKFYRCAVRSLEYHIQHTLSRSTHKASLRTFPAKAAVKAQKSVSESGEAVYLVRPMRALEGLHTCAQVWSGAPLASADRKLPTSALVRMQL